MHQALVTGSSVTQMHVANGALRWSRCIIITIQQYFLLGSDQMLLSIKFYWLECQKSLEIRIIVTRALWNWVFEYTRLLITQKLLIPVRTMPLFICTIHMISCNYIIRYHVVYSKLNHYPCWVFVQQYSHMGCSNTMEKHMNITQKFCSRITCSQLSTDCSHLFICCCKPAEEFNNSLDMRNCFSTQYEQWYVQQHLNEPGRLLIPH